MSDYSVDYDKLLDRLKNKEALDSLRVEITHSDLRAFIELVQDKVKLLDDLERSWDWTGA